MTTEKAQPKILIMNVNWLGDVLMSEPIFASLRREFPNAFLACMAPARVKDIFQCIPTVNEFILYDEEGEHKSLWGKIKLMNQLKTYRFDQVFILHKSLTRALIAFLAGIPKRIAYATKNRKFLLTYAFNIDKTIKHRLDEYQQLIENVRIPISRRNIELNVPKDLIDQMQQVLISHQVTENDFKILIHPAANWNLKRWPVKNFTQLINYLMQTFKAKVIITGGKEEKSIVDQIIAPLSLKPIVLVGETSLSQLAALMSLVNIVISADSGPMHLASAVSRNLIALFGPTDVAVTGPRGKAKTTILKYDVGCNKNPCYHLSCPDNVCMQAITVQKVIDAINEIRN